MDAIMSKILGASWRTSLVGWLGIAAGVAVALTQLIQGGFTAVDWKALALVIPGLGFLNAKDAKVSNAQTPGPAQTVTKATLAAR